ncbi:VanZ family protein [Desulfamplus magnetovallimortis]|uniref:VanZ family protein n=1 Tax=Desulfamplus magnetovallimortis TaxID=1246637 RepID=UPI0016473408|nr:VanZ family protein [Desulfamplus magnetovallimortis]
MIYCILIFVQSSFPSLEALPSFPFSDKLMHLGGYALLGALAVRDFKRQFKDKSRLSITICAIAFSTFYGATDEFHQSFVAGRSADLMDLLADFAGSVAGAWIFWRDIPYIDY